MADGVDKEKAEQKRRHYHAVALFRLYGVYLYEIAREKLGGKSALICRLLQDQKQIF